MAPELLALQPLSAFIASARDHNLDRREDAATVKQRETELLTARRALLPIVTARGEYTFNQYESKVTLPTATAVLVPQNQWDGYVIAAVPLVNVSSWVSIRAASLNQRAAGAKLEVTSVEVNKQVARAFYDVLSDRALAELAQRALATDQANLADVLVRRAAGTDQELDVARAQASVASSEQRTETALYNVAISERHLRTLSGLTPALGGMLVDDDLHDEAPLETFTGTRTAKEFAAELDEQAQRAVEDQSQTRLLPTLTATATERFTNATGFTNKSAFFQGVVTLNWTLDPSLLSQAASQHAATEVVRVRVARASQDKNDDVYSSWWLVKAQLATCRAARASAAAARLAYEVTKTRYAVGTARQIDLLQADRDAFSAEVTRIETNSDLRYDRIALRLVAGRSTQLEEVP